MNNAADATASLKTTIRYEPGLHHHKAVIFILFDYSARLNERVRKLVGVKWSGTRKAWYVPDSPTYRQKFRLNTMLVGKDVLAHIDPINQPALQLLVETLQLNTAPVHSARIETSLLNCCTY